MAFTKAVELFFSGIIISLVLLTFLAGIIPVAQETIDNAAVGAFAMGEASKLMLGLIGFVFVAGLLYAGVKELIRDDTGGSVQGGYYGR